MAKFFLYLIFILLSVSFLISFSSTVTALECYDYFDTTTCISNNCSWQEEITSEGTFSWCERTDCWVEDNTNPSICTDANVTYNLDHACVWDAGTSLCNPEGGNFFGNGCNDFNNDETGCYSTFFCVWNQTGSTCEEPIGGFTGDPGSQNPGCGIVSDITTCTNISGCSWTGTECIGNPEGIQCVDLNNSICSSVTFLSSCCNWNSTSCTSSFSQECFNNIPAPPTGATFCEDTNSYTNETLCNLISASPWYMPCIFNSSGKEECHFNSDAFGEGFATFDEISSEVSCEAQGGVWKNEQWEDTTGIIKTDSWCEFNFGSGGNCDATCWACESEADPATACTNSALGYCQWNIDSNAPNGGWCNPKQDFIQGGGKNCDDECNACDFLNNPETECESSFKGCVWVNDTEAANGLGNCFGKNEKRCDNDCFNCYTETDCSNSDTECTWDAVNIVCKTPGFTGEICFDGKDNDNDNRIDCLDSDCSTDKFCGGESLADSFGDCPSFTDLGESFCTASTCVWINDSFGGGFTGLATGHCDFPGSQCFIQDENEVGCNANVGCSYTTVSNGFCGEDQSLFTTCPQQLDSFTCVSSPGCEWTDDGFGGGFCNFPGAQCLQDENEVSCNANIGCIYTTVSNGFCGENKTFFEGCFQQMNSTDCGVIPNCEWINDSYSDFGRCEPIIFAQCFNNDTRHQNATSCEETVSGVQICSWTDDSFSPQGGFCDPVCFGLGSSVGACETPTNGLCELKSGFCEPDSFGGKCYTADGNITLCNTELNASCTYFPDAFANNALNGTLGNISGWCDSKGGAEFITFMGSFEPVILGVDIDEGNVNNTWDISGIGIKDDFDKLVLGIKLQEPMLKSGICNGIPILGTPGNGVENHTFFWYLDADGNTTNNCVARDNSSETGYEFSFKYQGVYGVDLEETKVAYRCLNGSWGPVPIPLTSSRQIMCENIGGGMAGIDKSEMFKFKELYNKSVDLRIYVSVSNITTNDSSVVDVAGPFYYSPGAIDFKFEDCANPGGDSDGDGLIASNDPDCFDFMKFGFVPNEIGFQCGDNIDNDGDGLTDCDDEGCSWDPFFCGGSLVASVNDKTAPTVKWLKADTFPDSAFIMYDTDEPANGTLTFYYNDSTCRTINSTILDVGLLDSSSIDYRMWHDAPIDNNIYNPQSLNYPLTNGTTYYYKTTVCDVSNNCGVSACLNFTTKINFASCKSCTSTLNFPFQAPTGAATSDPLGNLNFKLELPDGTEQNLSANSQAGAQFNYSQTKNFNLEISNPNATNQWYFKLINASINGKVASNIQNFSSSNGDITFNTSVNGSFIGLGNDKCQELINIFRPKKIEIGVPGNVSELWQCGVGLDACTRKDNGTDVDNNATFVGYDSTLNITKWQVPAGWGC